MRVPVPEYCRLIATAPGEAVLSTPGWYHEHGEDSTVFVDAHHWPPQLVKHAGRVAAAARLPDGQWAAVVKRSGEWRLSWFADIHAARASRSEPLPVPPPEDASADGPIIRLHAFAGRLVALALDGAVWLRDDAGWSQHPTLRGDTLDDVRDIVIGGKPALGWDGDVYDARLEPIDVRECGDLINAAGRLFAIEDSRLVDFHTGVPVLEEHEVVSLDPGPGDNVLMSFARVDRQGTQYDNAFFDARALTVTMLPEDKIGEFPPIVAFTDVGDIVLLDEDMDEDNETYALWRYPASEIAALPHVPVATLALPPRLRLDTMDAYGAASRPIVATSGDTIVIALGTELRFHTVDAPLCVHSLGRPIVAVASLGDQLGVLDWNGVLDTFDRAGKWLASRPTVELARSLAVSADAWIAIGRKRSAIIERQRTHVVELPDGIAAAADPDGDILFACEDRRLAYWSRGELRDLPPPVEQIVALAPLGDRRFACVGENELYELDLAQGELIRMDRQLIRPFIATHFDGETLYVAAVTDTGAVDVGHYAGDAKITSPPNSDVKYSGGYIEPADEKEITVRGLAFMDDGRLVIALDHGRGNIFDHKIGAALKLDPQPGDVRSRWMFFCSGKLLIAE